MCARVPGYLVAGKTGTADKYMSDGYSDTERISSFIGLIPADNPKLAIVVVIDGPTLGISKGAGIVAAPVFKAIAQPAMRQLGIPQDPALLEEVVPTAVEKDAKPSAPMVGPELRWDGSDHLLTPDLDGLSMRDALVTLQGSGLHIRFEGSGRVAQQSPNPGRPILPGQPVEVILQ
jgi:cell division protein FtsI (penicillin-binding protein 3)